MLSNFMNKPGGRISKGQQDEVLQLIRDNDRSITVVDCGKDLEEEFVAELCRALRSNRYVTTLRIRERELSLSVDALAALCAKTTTLVQLKISYANLSDDDAQVICGSMLNNKSIQSLSLDHNRIASPDAIVMLLAHNKTLDSLDLSFNNLGANGDRPFAAIADALGRNTTLKQLYLSGNGLSDNAARKLVEVLDQNLHTSKLRVLDIAAENSVRNETKQALKLVLEAGRQATQGNRTEDGDDLRSQLTGLGYAAAANVLSGNQNGLPATHARDDATDRISHADVQAWQEQVDVGSAQFDEERKELQAAIQQLKAEKEQSVAAQIAALEQTNKLQQQVALLTERNTSIQRELDVVSTKYDKKVKESTEQLQLAQQQLTAARKELVRQQEAAAGERTRIVEMQETMTRELGLVHDQLAAATRANDIIDQIAPPKARRGPTVDACVITDLSGLHAKTTLTSSRQAPQPNRASDDRWSESTGDTSVQHPASAQSVPLGPGRSPAVPAPPQMPRGQWVDDDYSHDCKSCRKEFNLTRRKHHCRLCGQLFCASCCPTHKQWNMRVCSFCLATHAE
jgi:hypothetical protein